MSRRFLPSFFCARGAPPPLARAAALISQFAWGPTPTRAAGADSLWPPQRGCRVGDPGSSRGPRALGAVTFVMVVVLGAPVLVPGRTSLASFAGVAETDGEGARTSLPSFIRVAQAFSEGDQAPTPSAAKPKTTVAAKTAPAETTSRTRATAAKKWTARRTPWGDPDLQGIWNFATSTPLERPAKFGEKPVLTDEEAAEFQEEVAFSLTRDRRDGGQEADVARAYNDHWMDARRLLILPDKRTSLIVDPPDGRIPPLVPLSPERQKAAQERAARARRFNAGMPLGPDDFAAAFRGIIRTDRMPYLGTIYNNTAQIFQSPGYVVLLLEMIHSARIVPVDGRPHLGPTLLQWLGDTRGRWDGNTLVLETTNFRRDDGVVYGNADPDTFRIVERFTRVGPDTLNYEFTISDPRTWTSPWTAMVPWTRIDEQLYEYTTHEDNYDMVHLLAGARAREARGETLPEVTPARRERNEER